MSARPGPDFDPLATLIHLRESGDALVYLVTGAVDVVLDEPAPPPMARGTGRFGPQGKGRPEVAQ
ncbi:MAG TPA: hypothetical protein VHO73_05920 [Methylomirabilota bacterium]|jgi:hypothetical protein|nr:hypothetical protein [Methylomirabilota bacterium]